MTRLFQPSQESFILLTPSLLKKVVLPKPCPCRIAQDVLGKFFGVSVPPPMFLPLAVLEVAHKLCPIVLKKMTLHCC